MLSLVTLLAAVVALALLFAGRRPVEQTQERPGSRDASQGPRPQDPWNGEV